MDLQLFKTFLSVAKLGNISQAAELLNFAQPTITTQIQTLEKSFGVLLFERVGKKIFLTEAGRLMINDAQRLMLLIEEIQANMEPFRKTNYSLTLGISTQMISYLLPPILEKLQTRLQGIQVSVETFKNTEEVFKHIANNHIDLGITHGEAVAAQIAQYLIGNEEILWVANKSMVSKHEYSPNILDYPIINFSKNGSVFRAIFDEAMGNKQVPSKIEYSDSEAVKRAVIDGLGASYLPRVLIQEEVVSGKLVVLNGPVMQLPIYLVIHKNKHISTAIDALLLTVSELPKVDNNIKGILASICK